MRSSLASAFSDPVLSAQATFRAVMRAMSRPGRSQGLDIDLMPPAPLSAGSAALALTLFDHETPVWIDRVLADSGEVPQWLRFHTGAPITDEPETAAFALVADAVNAPDFSRFARGTLDYPDRSTTLILQVDNMSGGVPLALTGPGIDGEQKMSVCPLPKNFAERMIENRGLFPRGIDVLLVSENAVLAIPRSTHVGRSG